MGNTNISLFISYGFSSSKDGGLFQFAWYLLE